MHRYRGAVDLRHATGPAKTAGVLLAAGAGSRFAGEGRPHKLLADFGGRPLIAWSLEAIAAAGFDVILVVTGAADLAAVLPVGMTVVHNPDWAGGLATSLARAVEVAEGLGCAAVVVGLGDQPRVRAEDWRAVAASDAPIAVATYGGRRRNPVRLGRAVWGELPESGDEGARALMLRRPELVVEVECSGDPLDVDTPEDLGTRG